MPTAAERVRQRLLDAGVQRQPASQTAQPQPITDEQRLIIQNIFDTQPKRRAEYLRKLGWEMNVKDPNEIRPLGSDTQDWTEIDPTPELENIFTAGFWRDLSKDAVNDVKDVAGDMALFGPIIGAGFKLGSEAGAGVGAGITAATGGTGAVTLPLTTLIGGVMGGALGNGVAETVKVGLQEVLTDPEVPVDVELAAIQSIMTGVMGKAMEMGLKGGKIAINKYVVSNMKKSLKATKNAMQVVGGFDQKIVDDAIKNPDKYTADKIKGALNELNTVTKDLLGEADETIVKTTRKIKSDSLFGKIVKPLNEQATEEIESLAKNPQANFKLFTGNPNEPGLIDGMTNVMDRILKKRPSERNASETAALKYMQGKIKSIVSDFAPDAINPETGRVQLSKLAGANKTINFKQGRNILKAVQEDAFDREVPGARFLAQAVGGGEDGLRALADRKAAALGSKLPEINAKRSELLTDFNELKTTLKPDALVKAFIGKDNIAKQNITEKLSKLDAQAGTNFVEKIRTGAFQNSVNELFERGGTTGSGSLRALVLESGVKEAAKQGGAAFALGAPFGIGSTTAKIGGMKGFVQGVSNALKAGSPRLAMKTIKQQAADLKDKIGPEEFVKFVEQEMNSSLDTTLKQELMESFIKAPARGVLESAAEGAKAIPSAVQAYGMGVAASPGVENLTVRTPEVSGMNEAQAAPVEYQTDRVKRMREKLLQMRQAAQPSQ